MAIASTLRNYLHEHDVQYELVNHSHSQTALESAHAASVPGRQVAKAVVLKDNDGFVVGVVPSNRRLDLEQVNRKLGRQLELADEKELTELYEDCEPGAVPALGDAYGLDVIWDDHLSSIAEVYIEAGDHENLIHLKGADFAALMADKAHGGISSEAG